MMGYSEDHIALAAEYVLGTLDAAERAQVELMMSVDDGFRVMVESWESRLGPLNQMVGAVEPPREVWEKIRTAVGLSHPQLPLILPDLAPPVAVTEHAVDRAVTANVIDFSSRARRWRGIATATTALAASLAALITVQSYRPELLPDGLRPKARIQVVEVAAPVQTAAALPAQFVAVLQQGTTDPAFILTVDTATKNFTVRRVGATQEPGKSYELWLVADQLQRPRSLGVIGRDDFTTRPVLAGYDSDTINKATYAVTLEPEGGSPTGQPTGQILFTGKLVETLPPGTPQPAR